MTINASRRNVNEWTVDHQYFTLTYKINNKISFQCILRPIGPHEEQQTNGELFFTRSNLPENLTNLCLNTNFYNFQAIWTLGRTAHHWSAVLHEVRLASICLEMMFYYYFCRLKPLISQPWISDRQTWKQTSGAAKNWKIASLLYWDKM